MKNGAKLMKVMVYSIYLFKLLSLLSQFGEPTDIEEIKRLTFSRNN